VEHVDLHGVLLGRMRVTVAGRPGPAAWPRPAARRLVALLLLAPDGARPREGLAEQLFPHLDPPRAVRALSKALSQARAALDAPGDGPSVLAADRGIIRFADHVDVEVDLNDHLAALRAGLADSDPRRRERRLRETLRGADPVLVDDRYEPWAIEAANEVERLQRDARVALARTSGAPDDWQAVADADPASEEACAALVAHHLHRGRRQEAARVVARCEDALAELGLHLDRELVSAVGRALPTPASSGASGEPGVPGSVAPADATAPDGIWPLFGRDRELGAVLATVGPAATGRGGALLIAAPAGMGKTHLLRHATAHLAAQGWVVATGASMPGDRLAPFASLRSALLPHQTRPAPPLVTRVLRPHPYGAGGWSLQPAELAVIADALRRHLDGLASSRPLVLCLDDVHWADQAQQQVLARLATGIDQRRWSLLLAARTDEPGSPVPEQPSTMTRLGLSLLDPAASQRLADHAAASVGIRSERHRRAVAARGRGHPFFTVELARSLEPDDELPDSAPPGRRGVDDLRVPARIVELLRRRVTTCSAAAQRVTALIAVAGDDASIDLIARTAPPLLGEVDLSEVLDALQRASLVHEEQRGLRLVHPLLRDAAESTIDARHRAELHVRVAEGLTGDPTGSPPVLSVARHRLAAFEASGSPEHAAAAVRAAVEGGSTAGRLGATAAAEELLTRAVAAFSAAPVLARDELRPAALEAWLGLHALRCDAGDYELAEAAVTEALALAGTPEERARAHQEWAQLPYLQGDIASSVARLEEGLRLLPDDARLARARLLVDLGWCRHRLGEADALPLLRRAVELAEHGEEVLLARALDRLGFVIASDGQLQESLVTFQRALSVASRCGDPRDEAITRLHHARTLTLAGRPYEARTELRRVADLCERHGMLYIRSLAHWAGADLDVSLGDQEGALAERDAELELLELLGNDRHVAGCQAHRAALLRELGRDDEAVTAATMAQAAAARVGDPVLIAEVRQRTDPPAG
jgi:DNA-binding SARP family transcriptional activator/tetratricopeptide (TPR) repeat protein